MADSPAANERLKLIANVLSNLGTALTATSFGRWFVSGFDAFVLIWLVTASGLIWSGWYVLTMMEAEK